MLFDERWRSELLAPAHWWGQVNLVKVVCAQVKVWRESGPTMVAILTKCVRHPVLAMISACRRGERWAGKDGPAI